MISHEVRINSAILRSIPINKGLKAYLIGKYRHLVKHNGQAEASRIFKSIREICLSYRADPHRIERREEYARKIPISRKNRVRQILHYMDTHPSFMLNLLKLYVGINQPIVTVEESAKIEDSYLRTRSSVVDTNVPSWLTEWVDTICTHWTSGWLSEDNTLERMFPGYLTRAVKGHSTETLNWYIRRWSKPCFTRFTEADVARALRQREPLPEMYKDWDSIRSKQLEIDLYEFLAMYLDSTQGTIDGSPALIPQEPMAWLKSKLSPFIDDLIDGWESGEALPPDEVYLDEALGQYGGYIHHIPKKGTTDRRPIAVPNRFLQMGLAPFAAFLAKVIRQFPTDATFDQDRFDTKIQNRVNNSNLYVGSVDLSHATDNLPFSWGVYLVETLFYRQLRDCHGLSMSWELFKAVSRGKWMNEEYLSTWTVGQPLGCLPSFGLLALTHNLYCESLSLGLGYTHSPYRILGDDIVIFSRKLRRRYIQDTSNRGIPLSLHKSYSGNLTEFAGKTYIKNNIPFYTTDQSAITFSNLFDWQKATGIRIPWRNLPKYVRKKWTDKCVKAQLSKDRSAEAYKLATELNVFDRGSSNKRIQLGKEAELYYLRYYDDEDVVPDSPKESGSVNICSHPVTYLDYGYAVKHGWKQRFREVELPDWYRSKFRPISTDKIVQCVCFALNRA